MIAGEGFRIREMHSNQNNLFTILVKSAFLSFDPFTKEMRIKLPLTLALYVTDKSVHPIFGPMTANRAALNHP